MIGYDYAEPYAGGSGLALRLLYDEFVDKIHINDLDQCIYSFWWAVTQRNIEFIDWLSDVNVDIDHWLHYREINKTAQNADLFELAKATFFLNRTNVSGVIKGGVIGGTAQLGKYKIDARFNKGDLINRIEKIGRFSSRINIYNSDGIDFIKKIEKRKTPVFIYLDPPYHIKGSDLYMNFYKNSDHEKLSNFVRRIKNKWMISYDDSEFIISLYEKYPKIKYSLSQSASNRVGKEIIIHPTHLDIEKSSLKLKEVIGF